MEGNHHLIGGRGCPPGPTSSDLAPRLSKAHGCYCGFRPFGSSQERRDAMQRMERATVDHQCLSLDLGPRFSSPSAGKAFWGLSRTLRFSLTGAEPGSPV